MSDELILAALVALDERLAIANQIEIQKIEVMLAIKHVLGETLYPMRIELSNISATLNTKVHEELEQPGGIFK